MKRKAETGISIPIIFRPRQGFEEKVVCNGLWGDRLLKNNLNKKVLWWVLAGCLYLGITFVFLGEVILHPLSMQVGSGGDPNQAMWFLGSFWNAVIHGHNPLISTLMNYPSGVNMMAVTSIMAESAILGPLAYLTNTIFIYNLLFTVNSLLSCYLGTLILMKLDSRRWLSILGGGLFGLMPYYTAHAFGHANLLTIAFILAIIYMSIGIMVGDVKRPRVYGSFLGFMMICQFYTSTEIFATASLMLLILLVSLYLFAREKFSGLLIRKNIITLSVALGIFTLFALPGILELFFGDFTISYSIPVQARNYYVNDFLNFILPTHIYLLHDQVTTVIDLKYTGNLAEQNGYLGIPAILLFLWAVQRIWKRKLARVLFFMVLIAAILSMGPYLHILGFTTKLVLPWIFFDHLPLIKQALPSRLMFYGDIGVIILIILAMEDYLKNTINKNNFLIFILITSVYLTWLPIIPFPTYRLPQSNQALLPNGTFYDSIKGHSTAVFTKDFNLVMPALADGHYAFPVVNLYGYANNSQAMTNFKQLLEINEDSQQVLTQNYLAGLLKLTKTERLVYIPIPNSKHNLYKNFETLLGEPIIDNSGSLMWEVPNNIKAVWFDGKVWDDSHEILEGIPSWCGSEWSTYSSGQEAIITITAPPKTYKPQGVSLKVHKENQDQMITLKPDQSIKISLPANSALDLSSADTFVPEQIIHNGDTRELSVQMAIKIFH